MIVTVTPNPSVDWTLELPGLVRGLVHRVSRGYREPSGKGVNVSRALTTNGVPTVAVLPLGGAEGIELEQMLGAEQVAFVPVAVAGTIRVNISLTEPDGTATKINSVGPTLSGEETQALLDAAGEAAARDAAWVLGSGSLPGGAPRDFYRRLADAMHATGARFALDSAGSSLRAGLAAEPDLVKPNLEELADVVGRAIATVADATGAAQELRALGARSVVVSLGADGALLVDGDGVLHAEAAVARPRSTVGAGDALVAGYLAGSVRPGSDRAAVLREAVAWGSAAVQEPGSHVPLVRDEHRRSVTVREPDPGRRIAAGPG